MSATTSSSRVNPKSRKAQKKSARSVLGTPAQRNQSSRKGKRTWRKNVDIEDVEEGLEEMRVEERITGSVLYLVLHNPCSPWQL